MGSTKLDAEQCPDCGRPLHHVWDYPANELWCVHCGNRYFANMRATESANSEASAAELPSGFRVLLLDEVGGRRDRLVRQFTRLGYQVTPVCHPRQALEAASFRRFDLVVLPAMISEFNCVSIVGKLKHLLGNLKFVVVAEKELRTTEFQDPDVVCASADEADYLELERTVEQLADELAAARIHHRPAAASDLDELLV